MQVETLQNVPQAEKKQYLRVATIAHKTALCYYYIGTNPDSHEILSSSFTAGFTAEDLDAAKKALRLHDVSEIDVIVIDVPYDEKSLREFHSFLKNRDMGSIPVIYNDCHFRNQEALLENDFIDDIIDLCNFQYDFSSKITFLKKAKQYSFSTTIKKLKVTPEKSLLKRALDIIIASALLIVLLPLFLLIALAIRIESKGPIFYNAKRAGRGFRIFKFYKFRTMEVNADKKIDALAHLNQYSDVSRGARFFKINNDPRITRVGKFLRNTSMDELPQLFNVLKGDMSLVGNRPLPLYEAATLTTNEFVERFMAPAGITGLWQIKKRGNRDMSTEERINLDISYARNSNLLYDFWIMAHTPKALLQKNDV
jgi:lipopolysaccharide/colanic/teichoic acid biosynthesis glycosyltransferase